MRQAQEVDEDERDAGVLAHILPHHRQLLAVGVGVVGFAPPVRERADLGDVGAAEDLLEADRLLHNPVALGLAQLLQRHHLGQLLLRAVCAQPLRVDEVEDALRSVPKGELVLERLDAHLLAAQHHDALRRVGLGQLVEVHHRLAALHEREHAVAKVGEERRLVHEQHAQPIEDGGGRAVAHVLAADGHVNRRLALLEVEGHDRIVHGDARPAV